MNRDAAIEEFRKTDEVYCSCSSRDLAPSCMIHGEHALARRNDRFYYYASLPWVPQDPYGSYPGRYRLLVDLLGTSIRIAHTQAVYIATREEASEFEKSFGPARRPCDCKQAEKEFRGESLLYGSCTDGVYANGVFEDFDKAKKYGRYRTGLASTRPHPYDPALLIDIDWGDVETSRHRPSLWEMRMGGERVLSVWRVTPWVVETALLVFAEEPDWKKRLEAYRAEQRRTHGIEKMRIECGLGVDRDAGART